jgi:NAD(P)-dependent dehydrogenase (short-subunit alcohol dehydrogenase family)
MNSTTSATPHRATAAVTGAGSGLGRDLAVKLAAEGYQVFGTALARDEIDDVQTATGGAATLALTDITDDRAVQAWSADVARAVGDRGLDVLISNAGILTPGPLEVLPVDAVRREFEVNVFGGVRVINALLPALRKARGRIVLIGAMTGRFPVPFNGPSSASKAALDALADIYRNELAPFGIEVVIAEAGNMRTGGPAKTAAALRRVAEAMTDAQRVLYGDAFGHFTEAMNASQAAGLSSEESAARVIELVEMVPAPARAPVGEDAQQILRLVRELSDAELDELRRQVAGQADA